MRSVLGIILFVWLLPAVLNAQGEVQPDAQTVVVRKNPMDKLCGKWVETGTAKGRRTTQAGGISCFTSRNLQRDGFYTDTVYCKRPRQKLADATISYWNSGQWSMSNDTLILRYTNSLYDDAHKIERYVVQMDAEGQHRLYKLPGLASGPGQLWARPEIARATIVRKQ